MASEPRQSRASAASLSVCLLAVTRILVRVTPFHGVLCTSRIRIRGMRTMLRPGVLRGGKNLGHPQGHAKARIQVRAANRGSRCGPARGGGVPMRWTGFRREKGSLGERPRWRRGYGGSGTGAARAVRPDRGGRRRVLRGTRGRDLRAAGTQRPGALGSSLRPRSASRAAASAEDKPRGRNQGPRTPRPLPPPAPAKLKRRGGWR